MPIDLQPERLYFEETDGQRRRVTLSGNEAPFGHFRGEPAFSMGGEVRRSNKWEPGTGPPAVHVTGTKENDLVVRGHLRDSLTGNNGFGTDAVAPLFEGRARRIRDEIEAIRTSARPLRITWQGGLAGGLLAKTDFGHEADGEYTYELTFEIHWRGSPPKRRVRRPLAMTTVARELGTLVEVDPMVAKLVAVPGISMTLADDIASVLGACVAPMAQLLALANAIESGASDAVDAAASAVTRCHALLNALTEAIGFLQAAGIGAGLLDDPTADAASAAAWRRARADALNALYDAAAKTYQLGVDAERKAAGVSSGVYTSVAGDTLDAIALRLGIGLAKLRAANPTLPLGRLVEGTKVRVPGA